MQKVAPEASWPCFSPVKLMCERCTYVAEHIGRLKMQLTMPRGVRVLSHEVIIRGLCRECALPSLPRTESDSLV